MMRSAKLSKAFVALVWFLPSVNPHMHLEMSHCIRGKWTCFTKPVFLILVNGFYMCLQRSHLRCNVVTQIATELFFFMNRSNVNVQTALGFKSFVALITFERAQYMYCFLWLFEVATVANIWAHLSHGIVFFLCFTTVCFCNCFLFAKFFWQICQTTLSTGLCFVITCSFKSAFRLKSLSHWSHLKRSPIPWTTRW